MNAYLEITAAIMSAQTVKMYRADIFVKDAWWDGMVTVTIAQTTMNVKIMTTTTVTKLERSNFDRESEHSFTFDRHLAEETSPPAKLNTRVAIECEAMFR